MLYCYSRCSHATLDICLLWTWVGDRSYIIHAGLWSHTDGQMVVSLMFKSFKSLMKSPRDEEDDPKSKNCCTNVISKRASQQICINRTKTDFSKPLVL